MDIVEGINEEELSNLSLEILDYADRISEIFDKIDNCISRLPECYRGESCNAILDTYYNLAQYYEIIKENIVSYSNDYITLIQKMRENDKYLTILFQNYTDETQKKTKSINN